MRNMKKPRTKTTEKHLLLKSLVGINKGWNKGCGLVQLKKETLLTKLQSKKALTNFSNTDLDLHCAGQIHLYYSSYYSVNKQEAVIAIDNDMKERDIIKYDSDLTDLYYWEDTVLPLFFPGIKAFRSKGGIGSHCMFKMIPGVEYRELNSFQKNKKARDLQIALEKELEKFRNYKNYKFTKVELKGTNTVVNWKTGDINFGALCLLPRTDEHIKYVANEIPTFTFRHIQKLVFNLKKYNDSVDNLSTPKIEIEKLSTKPKVMPTGSVAVKIVTLDKSYGEFYYSQVLRGEEVRSNDGRYLCNEEDFTVMISIIKALQEADIKTYGHVKQMSFSRIKAMWNALIESGETTIAFNDRKVTAMRNSLSENGFIDWISEKYCGNKACVFKLNNEFLVLLTQTTQHTPTCVVTFYPVRGSSEHKLPVFDSSVNPFTLKAVKMMEAEEAVLQLCG